jgi:hypothetical protein
MGIGQPCGHPPPRRAHQKSLLNQVRLQHILNRVTCLADRGSNVVQPDGTAIKLVNQGLQQPSILMVEPPRIDLKQVQSIMRDLVADLAITSNLGKITGATQQPIGDPRRTTRSLPSRIKKKPLNATMSLAQSAKPAISLALHVT